ncbi:HDIG domain-containing protein [soil metagenome]
MQLSEWAEGHARNLLEPLHTRWHHAEAVAAVARTFAFGLLTEDEDVLVAAAYLHDVGYAPELAATGFHPLDSARYLRSLGHDRLAGLVAHHTGSAYEAKLRGHEEALAAFGNERSLVTAALAYSDLTTGPDGQRMTPGERLLDVERRYGADSVVAKGLRAAWPGLMELLAEEAMLRAPVTDHPM